MDTPSARQPGPFLPKKTCHVAPAFAGYRQATAFRRHLDCRKVSRDITGTAAPARGGSASAWRASGLKDWCCTADFIDESEDDENLQTRAATRRRKRACAKTLTPRVRCSTIRRAIGPVRQLRPECSRRCRSTERCRAKVLSAYSAIALCAATDRGLRGVETERIKTCPHSLSCSASARPQASTNGVPPATMIRWAAHGGHEQ